MNIQLKIFMSHYMTPVLEPMATIFIVVLGELLL